MQVIALNGSSRKNGNTGLILQAVLDALAERGLGYETPFRFPYVGEFAPLVEASGFRLEYAADAVARLRDALCRDGAWLADYVRLRGRSVKP